MVHAMRHGPCVKEKLDEDPLLSGHIMLKESYVNQAQAGNIFSWSLFLLLGAATIDRELTRQRMPVECVGVKYMLHNTVHAQ